MAPRLDVGAVIRSSTGENVGRKIWDIFKVDVRYFFFFVSI